MNRSLIVGLVVGALASACGGDGGESKSSKSADAANPQAVAEAKQVWNNKCVSCHGNEGKGNGPASASLNPKPRSFGDKKWQLSVTDEHLEKVILGGGKAVGLSETMPANPNLKDKPEVVDELVKIVRSFK
jgi:mono/diheme cytochrome c family protein